MNDKKYRYSYNFGLLGLSRVVEILVDSTRGFDGREMSHRSPTSSITPHPRNIKQWTLISAPYAFPVNCMTIHPTIDHRYLAS